MFEELVDQLDITDSRVAVRATQSMTVAGRYHL